MRHRDQQIILRMTASEKAEWLSTARRLMAIHRVDSLTEAALRMAWIATLYYVKGPSAKFSPAFDAAKVKPVEVAIHISDVNYSNKNVDSHISKVDSHVGPHLGFIGFDDLLT